MAKLRQCVFIDLRAPWHHAESTYRRVTVNGKYFVQAKFITGKPPAYEYVDVTFWLPAGSGHDFHTFFKACAEITNSRLHPSHFEGKTLPTAWDVDRCDECARILAERMLADEEVLV